MKKTKVYYSAKIEAPNLKVIDAGSLSELLTELHRYQLEVHCSVVNAKTGNEVFSGCLENVTRDVKDWIERVSFNKSE